MKSIVQEYRRYRTLLERAINQISDKDFFRSIGESDNSVAIILNHIASNFLSRFTDFLTTDGEKDWRNRDAEFKPLKLSKKELLKKWEKAWAVLENNVFGLSSKDLRRFVFIRGVKFTVKEALLRSLSHFSYHVGQIVFLAKHFSGASWNYLTIPPGQSQQYNQNPTREKGFNT